MQYFASCVLFFNLNCLSSLHEHSDIEAYIIVLEISFGAYVRIVTEIIAISLCVFYKLKNSGSVYSLHANQVATNIVYLVITHSKMTNI